jgi:hypothetical protein
LVGGRVVECTKDSRTIRRFDNETTWIWGNGKEKARNESACVSSFVVLASQRNASTRIATLRTIRRLRSLQANSTPTPYHLSPLRPSCSSLPHTSRFSSPPEVALRRKTAKPRSTTQRCVTTHASSSSSPSAPRIPFRRAPRRPETAASLCASFTR